MFSYKLITNRKGLIYNRILSLSKVNKIHLKAVVKNKNLIILFFQNITSKQINFTSIHTEKLISLSE